MAKGCVVGYGVPARWGGANGLLCLWRESGPPLRCQEMEDQERRQAAETVPLSGESVFHSNHVAERTFPRETSE